MPGSQRRFCASLPKSVMGSLPTDACTSRMIAVLAHCLATSSMKMAKAR